MKLSTFLTILTILIHTSNGQGHRSKSPEIGAYVMDFKDHIIDEITSGEDGLLILPQLNILDHYFEGKNIRVLCNSSAPVKWTYFGNGAPSVQIDTTRNSPKFFDYNTYTYSSSILFTHTNYTQTGLYTCQVIQNPEIYSSFYIFVQGEKAFLLDISVKHNIYLEDSKMNFDGNDQFILPCSVSSPEIPVSLFKGNEKIDSNSDIKFDSKLGFIIKMIDKDFSGDYFCSAEIPDGRNETLHFNVIKGKNLDYSSEKADDLKITFQDKIGEIPAIKCCSKTRGISPKMKKITCKSPSDCDGKLAKLQRTRDFEHQVSENVQSFCSQYELHSDGDSGFIECSLDSHISKYLQFSYENGYLFKNFDMIPPAHQTIQIIKDEYFDLGKKRIIHRYTCHANNFYFSHGLRWAYKTINETLEFAHENDLSAHTNRIEIDDGTFTNLSHTHLYCFAPIWNSPTHWKSIAISI